MYTRGIPGAKIGLMAGNINHRGRASFEIDPFQSMMTGLSAMIPISFGLPVYIVDYSHQFILKLFPELGLAGRLIMLVIGIVILQKPFLICLYEDILIYVIVYTIVRKTNLKNVCRGHNEASACIVINRFIQAWGLS